MNYAEQADTVGNTAPPRADKTFSYCWLTNFKPQAWFSYLYCSSKLLQLLILMLAFYSNSGSLYGFLRSIFLKEDHDKNI